MKSITKVAKVITKIGEIFHWVGVVLLALAAIVSLVNPGWLKYLMSYTVIEGYGVELTVYDFEILAPVVNGNIDMKLLAFFCITGLIILSLMAMVYRNMNLIIKKSIDDTPFQKDNIRMLKEIGIFAISGPIVGIIMSIICHIIFGDIETSVNMSGISLGIIVLCLTEFFIYGANLQKDVDGLL